jgi:hypothetical protein
MLRNVAFCDGAGGHNGVARQHGGAHRRHAAPRIALAAADLVQRSGAVMLFSANRKVEKKSCNNPASAATCKTVQSGWYLLR